MDFRILGPVEVFDARRPVAIRRGKQLALLAYLLLHANRPIASERLVEELWRADAPPTAPKILQNEISRLRKALGDDRLLTRPPGYMLRVDPGELDRDRFLELVDRARRERDAQSVRDALALWRGDPLDNVRDEEFAQRAAAELEEARLAAEKLRVDLDLAEGRHGDLVGELERLSAAHPYDQHLYLQLMLALHGAGRSADALDAYARARRTLDEDLGLAPGRELDELQHRILNDDVPLPRPHALSARPRQVRRMTLAGGAVVLAATGAALVAILLTRGDPTPRVVADSLVKVDAATGDVRDVIDVGRQPVAVAATRNAVWVSNIDDSTVTHIDLASGRSDTIGTAAPPLDIVGDGPDHAWISTYNYERVIRLDGRSLRPDATVALHRRSFLLGTGGGTLWVTEPADNLGEAGTVARVDLKTASLQRAIRVGVFPVDVKVGHGAAWVSNGAAASITRINLLDESRADIPVAESPGPLAVAFGSIWVIAGRTADSVYRVNARTRRVEAVVHVGRNPFNIEPDAAGIWVALRGAGMVEHIDARTNRVSKRLHLGYKPQGMSVANGILWVTVGHGELPGIR